MGMTINTNIPSLNAQRNLGKSQGMLQSSLQRLSSGLRINGAKDDAAGLAISNRMGSQIRGLNQAIRNANDGISLAQTAEGALQETTNILQRIRELSIQAANDTNSSSDRASLQAEVNQLQQELTRIAETTTFNGKKLLEGSFATGQFQVGAEANQTISFSIDSAKATDIGSNTLETTNDTGIEASTRQGVFTTNGSEVGKTVVAASGTTDNGLTGEVLTVRDANGDSVGTVTVAEDEEVSTVASDLSDLGSFVTASGYNQVTILSSHANTTNDTDSDQELEINGTNLGVLDFTDADDIAEAINGDSTLQGDGVFAISDGSDVVVYNNTGDDITVENLNGGQDDAVIVVQGLDGAGPHDVDDAEVSTSAGKMQVVLAQGYTIETSVDDQLLTDEGAETAVETTAVGYTDGTVGNAVGAQKLTIVGPEGSNAEDIDIEANSTAAGIATAVNAETANTGVKATALTTATLSDISADGTVSFDLFGTNDTAVSVSATVTTGNLNSLAKAINDVSGQTGITAELSGSNDEITLTQASGEDIKVVNFSHSAAVDAHDQSSSAVEDSGSGIDWDGTEVSMMVTGNEGEAVSLYDGGTKTDLDSTVVGGKVVFSASGDFNITSDIDKTDAGGSIFEVPASSANTSELNTVSNIDISTVAGATDAITTVDGALDQVDSIRGGLGAIQNRFETTISNLQSVSENLEAARSRILDADFAAETAAMTKAQIMQQAGTAMLAQANMLPQTVLSLLQ
jgi:flagellin